MNLLSFHQINLSSHSRGDTTLRNLFLLFILLVLATFACFSGILGFLRLIFCLWLLEKNSDGSPAIHFYTFLARDSIIFNHKGHYSFLENGEL